LTSTKKAEETRRAEEAKKSASGAPAKAAGLDDEPKSPKDKSKAPSSPRLTVIGGGGNKCFRCQKSVYQNEQIAYDGKYYHPECFRCLKCKNRVVLINVAMISGDLYCKACFKKTFMEKGKYTSFGVGTPEWDKEHAKGAAHAEAAPAADPTAV